jgi:Ca2+-binding RTX toxin-like protein
VNLPLGTASSLTGGISNIQNVIGSAFDDILIGNGGNVLSGGAGRDFLVAGRTPSTLNGGDGEDILIGGFLYAADDDGELNPDAIEAIAAEWFRRDVNYATRSETLQNLLAGPMIRNGGVNELMGQGDLDLFFANEDDLGDWNGVELRVTG